jgi:hypothetical protein
VYSLYADLLAGRIGEDVVMRVLQRGRVYEDVVAETVDAVRTIQHGDVVERILIHLERQTPPDDFRTYGPRVVPFYNYLQAAFVLQEDQRLGADGVLRVAVELVTEHRFDGDALARSYLDVARRGHLRGVGVPALRSALDGWFERGHVPAGDELRALGARLPSMEASAKAAFRAPAGEAPPDYEKLVEAHNPRRGRVR